MSKLTPERNLKKVRKAILKLGTKDEICQEQPGIYFPFISISSCEGKKDCAEVCPENVFEIAKIKAEDYNELSFFGKLKSKVHGGVVAYAVNADACRACGLCVVACPEGAIEIRKRTSTS